MIDKEALLDANAIEIAAWWKALEQIANQDLSAAVAIRKHLGVLIENEARIEDSLPTRDGDGSSDREIWRSADATWRAIAADLPSEKVLEIRRYVAGLRQLAKTDDSETEKRQLLIEELRPRRFAAPEKQ